MPSGTHEDYRRAGDKANLLDAIDQLRESLARAVDCEIALRGAVVAANRDGLLGPDFAEEIVEIAEVSQILQVTETTKLLNHAHDAVAEL